MPRTATPTASTSCRADAAARPTGSIAAALEADEPLTRPELAGALAQAGIVADGLRLGYIMMHAELEELVCSGPRRGNQHTYARFESRVPESRSSSTREEALAELSLRYFRSRGPATIRDFSAWSGPHGRRCEDRTGTGG